MTDCACNNAATRRIVTTVNMRLISYLLINDETGKTTPKTITDISSNTTRQAELMT